MRKIIIAALLAASFTAPASAATLWNVITTDTTEKSLKHVKVVDADGQSRSLSSGIMSYCLVPYDHIIHSASVHTDFDGPGDTATKVHLDGDGADTIEAGMIAKYGRPDTREVIHVHTDPVYAFHVAIGGENADHIVMKWRKDIQITFNREATGDRWEADYEAITASPAEAAASL